MNLRHAIKSGLAAAFTLALYPWLLGVHAGNPAWAVVSAVLVMQSNLGGLLRAAGLRMLGTAIGVVLCTLFALPIGVRANGPVDQPLVVGSIIAATLAICSRLQMQEAYRLSGTTVVIVLLLRDERAGWMIGLDRLLDVFVGIVVALLTQALIWPGYTRRELRAGIVTALADARTFAQTVLVIGLGGTYPRELVESQWEKFRDNLAKAKELLKDRQREPGNHRTEDAQLSAFLDVGEELKHYLRALDHAIRNMETDTFYQLLRPQIDALVTGLQTGLDYAIARLEDGTPPAPPLLDAAVTTADAAFADLRHSGAILRVEADEVLRFGAFFFSLRAAARQIDAVRQLLLPK
jgi:uncharacterized membrane protein YgaE (UPF0421/DUF939 family)